MQPTSSTRELFARGQAGDALALSQAFGRMCARLRGWTRARLPRDMRGNSHTQDVLHDAAVSVLQRMDRLHLKEAADLEAYIRQTIVNRIRDRSRWRRRHPQEPLDIDRVSPAESPLDAAIRQERWRPYQAAFDALSEPERDALIARFDLDLGYEAIAELTNRSSAAAARMTVNRAIDKLRASAAAEPRP